MRYRFFFMLVACLAMAMGARPSNAAVPMKPGTPDVVQAGVWLSGIHNIDFHNGSFGAEFYMWWVGPNPDFAPFKSLQILNGRDWSTRAVNQRRLSDGSYYTSAFVDVTINNDWDLRYYPFDKQKLRIVIETPYTSSELKIVPDVADSKVGEFVDVKGFRLDRMSLQEVVQGYNTNFGLRGARGDHYSRLIVELDASRESGRLAIVIFLGFIVANLIALFTCAIEVTGIGTRVNMITAAVFGATGNMYLLSSELNPAAGSLLIDRFAVGTFVTIIDMLLVGIVVHRLARWDKIRVARIANWASLAVVVIGAGFYYWEIFGAALH